MRITTFIKTSLMLALTVAVAVLSGCSQANQGETRTTLGGDWEMTVNPELSTPDEADAGKKVYYTFSEPGKYGDGVYKTIFDGGVEEGKYKLSEKDGKDYINMGTEDLEYSISDSVLTITYPEKKDEQTGEKTQAKTYVFEPAKAPDYENESYDSFTTDEKLSGEWKTDERTLEYYTAELSYTETVSFNPNGVMTIHYESRDLALDRYMYYAYSAADGELRFSLVTDKATEYKVSYKVSGKELTFSDDTSASIFADAFFGDVKYKNT